MVLLRFLLSTATSSRFPTGNKLFLKNANDSLVCFLLLGCFHNWLFDVFV